ARYAPTVAVESINRANAISHGKSFRLRYRTKTARCVAKIHSDQLSSCFLGAGGIFSSMNCDPAGSLPIEARSDLALLCVNNGTFPGIVMCSASFVIALQSMKAKRLCRLSV